MAGWSALPTWWVREPGLTDFLGGGKSGASIAELKTYIGLTVLADFKTKKVKTSISDLELLTGLSRPMVIRGIKGLENRGMLNVVRDGHINHYELIISGTDDKWGKVPNDALRLHLPEIINRGAATLAAGEGPSAGVLTWTLYLPLSTICPKDSAFCKMDAFCDSSRSWLLS